MKFVKYDITFELVDNKSSNKFIFYIKNVRLY